jgi:hypothetical protein
LDCLDIAANEDGGRNASDHEELGADCSVILRSHEHERAAHEDQGQSRQCIYRAIAVRRVKGDLFEVERHRHEYQSGERDCTRSDKQKSFHRSGVKMSATNTTEL